MAQRLNVAIVGCGIGREHAAAYQQLADEFRIVAVCDIDADKARTYAHQWGSSFSTTRFDDLCAMDEVDVIDICTPPSMHFAQCQMALEAGKHVICEKPLVASLEQVDALVALEAKATGHLMPIFQYRFGHGTQKLKYLAEQGLTGTAYLTTIETAWRRRAAYYAVPWRGRWETELGGTLLGHAIHNHDLLTYVLGPVRSVYARTTTRVNPIEVEDCAAISLEMVDGSLATLAATVGSSAEISRQRFCFSTLTAESNTSPYASSSDPWTFVGDTPDIQGALDAALARFQPLPEGYVGQFSRYHAALANDTALPVTLQDARVALELLTAMYYSASTKEVVDLPLQPTHPMYGGWQPR